jgi:hypothetical protein
MWYESPSLRLVLAIVVVIVSAVVVITTGDSWAVRWLVSIVALDIAARLALKGRSGP